MRQVQVDPAYRPRTRSERSSSAEFLEVSGLRGNAARLYYEHVEAKAGQPTFLLIHGLASDSRDFDAITTDLAAKGQGVLRVDLLGHGRTLEASAAAGTGASADSAGDIYLEDQCTALLQLIEERGVRRLRLVGHSYGAAVALELASNPRLRDSVEAIHLLAPFVRRVDASIAASFESTVDAWDKIGCMTNPLYRAGRTWLSSALPGLYEASKKMLPNAEKVVAREALERTLSRFVAGRAAEHGDPGGPSAASKVAAAMSAAIETWAYDARSIASELQLDVPIQILQGGRDLVTHKSQASELAEALRSKGLEVDLRVLPEATHMLPVANAQEVSQCLTAPPVIGRSLASRSEDRFLRGITPISGPGDDAARLARKRSWDAPVVPRLPGKGTELELFDTARGRVAETAAHRSGPATMYVCGITPYDATHLGHAATMITFDLVQRVWRDAGLDVRFVQNVTDIDDPLLRRANRDGESWVDLALRETERFRTDMVALRVIPPAHYVGAVESIPTIVEKVATLLEKGLAYQMDDGTGDVYFNLATAPRFGYESNYDRQEMLRVSADRGGDPERAGKRDPLDPLLWRGAREGEPAWPGGSLGPGRPGWHIECTIIAQGLLGPTIDVQGGGSDLMFPHHECSSAHAEALSGESPFAAHYVHTGMLELNGEKMSKRKGNLIFLSRLTADHVDPMAVRLTLITQHYRVNRQWTPELLDESVARLARWRAAASAPTGPSAAELLATVRVALAKDLDTPAAIQAIDQWVDEAQKGEGADSTAPALVATMIDSLLGIRL